MKIIFVISPRTHFLDLAGPDQVFFEAIFFGAPFEIEYCTYAEEPSTSSGLFFKNLRHFSEIEPERGDYIVVPGMDRALVIDGKGGIPKELYAWLSTSYERKASLCSVCTGAYLLAASGLLDGRPCTTHWKFTGQLQQLFPKVRVVENVLFTEKDGILTSAGIASGIDLALHIVEKEAGAMLAHKVARELVVYNRRNGIDPQQSALLDHRNHIHAGVHAVQDWLQDHLGERPGLDQLAELANMSPRNFTRIFRKETGISVGGYIAQVRREKARELAKNPDLSRAQVATRVGLASERQLNRLMKTS